MGGGRIRWWTALVAVCLAIGPAAASSAQSDAPRVLVVTLDGMIGPVTARHVVDGVERAEDGGYDAFVLRVDTPGGLDTSMRDIVKAFLGAEVPVVVHVAPRGARAASAGAVITLASHIAAMAPGTVIGAATPVDLEGGDVERKVVNDAAAFSEELAQARGRNVEFAGDMVREGRSATATEAVEIGVVELRASSLDELLDEIDGRQVELASGRTVALRTAEAVVDEYELSFARRILQVLADPNLAFLFMSIGTLAVIYELAAPGVGAAGILGASMIVLALFSFSVLPLDLVGLLFMGLAAALFAAELFAPGIGIFASLGALSLALGGLFLFDDASGFDVSLGVVLPTAVVVGLATVVAGRLALRTRHAPDVTGPGAMVGRVVEVRRRDESRGQAFVDGAWWSVRPPAGAPLADEGRVVAVDGLDLVVEPLDRADTDKKGDIDA